MTLALLTALVERMRVPTLWFRARLNEAMGHLFSVSQIQLFHLGLVLLLLLLFVFAIPAAVFTSIEPEWSYLVRVWHCFV